MQPSFFDLNFGYLTPDGEKSQLPKRAPLLLFDDYRLQIGDPLLQLSDDHILPAEAIRDAGITHLIAGPLAEISEQYADKYDQDYACPHGHVTTPCRL
jgi:hypothetical protein